MKKDKPSTYKQAEVIEKSVLVPDLGKLPPQAPELEAAVLGALLMESKSIEKVDLSSADFYMEKNQVIFMAIESLRHKRQPVDILTVLKELKCMKAVDKAGGAIYLAELTEKIASAAHLEYHAAIVKQKSIARKLIIQSQNVIQHAYDESVDIQDMIEYMEKSLTEIRSGTSSTEYLSMSEAIEKTLNYLLDVSEKKERGELTSIPTGLKGLDNQLNGGWTAPDLIVIGGRPGMGKTQFALHFAEAASANDKYCLFISIEMTAEQLIMRMMVEDESLSLHNMKTGQMAKDEWLRIDERVKNIESNKLFIADNYNIRNLSNIKSMARKLHREKNLDLLIIDYLQLIKTGLSFGTRDIEIGYITGELKNLAKELNIPVILLAQLNRPLKGGGKQQTPTLTDLRESGNIEQDADKVLFPHRPSYYDPEVEEKNKGYIIIAKNREGSKDGRVYFQTDDRFKKISDGIAPQHTVDASKEKCYDEFRPF